MLQCFFCAFCLFGHQESGEAKGNLVINVKQISIHAPTRGATSDARRSVASSRYFNPRPHAGGDGVLMQSIPSQILFQSTPPRGGRQSRPCRSCTPPAHFNPRPHTGNDDGLLGHILPGLISIHALTGGSGVLKLCKRLGYQNFNPRPHTGGRQRSCSVSAQRTNFNPRPYDGATSVTSSVDGSGLFQSTPPREGRREGISDSYKWIKFQSAPPRGGRRWNPTRPSRCRNFNPRPHAGATRSPRFAGGIHPISIHAPTRGATSWGLRPTLR